MTACLVYFSTFLTYGMEGVFLVAMDTHSFYTISIKMQGPHSWVIASHKSLITYAMKQTGITVAYYEAFNNTTIELSMN